MNKKTIKMSIKTTSLCNRRCKNCQLKPWMDKYPDFHTSLEQIQTFIDTSKKYQYHYEYIIISGGEPLLWENLVEGTGMLSEARLACKLALLTNGKAIDDKMVYEINEVVRCVDNFCIAQTHENQENIDYALRRWGKLRKKDEQVINVVDRRIHMIPPVEPLSFSEALPAVCRSESLVMSGDFIQACALSTMYRNMDYKKLDKCFVNADFMKIFSFEYGEELVERFDCKWCSMCIANKKVGDTLRKETA